MTYLEAKSQAFAFGTVPNGYYGDRTKAWFTFDPISSYILVVHASGFHKSLLPPCSNRQEAEWIIEHHPVSKKYYTVSAINRTY